MPDAAVIAALRGLAQTLLDQARSHKRLENYHRRHAMRLQRKAERLVAMCDAHGIQLSDTEPGRGSQS